MLRYVLITLLCILAAAPAGAAFAHDIWLSRFSDLAWARNHLYPSDLGWIWVHYHGESYDWVRGTLDPYLWNHYIDPLLTQSAVKIGVFFMIFIYLILITAKIFGLPPFSKYGLIELKLKSDKDQRKHPGGRPQSRRARMENKRSGGAKNRPRR